MKKLFSKVLIAICAVGLVVAVSSCDSKKDHIVNDEYTVNVRVFSAGYGADWVYDLKDAFEEAYEEEGYKLNILTPSYDAKGTKVIQELYQGYSKTGIDLYISGDIRPNAVSAAGDYGLLVEDLEQIVYNQKAISYDGTEESKTVADKMLDEYDPFCRADNGALYGFAYAQSSAGLVVNTRKLAKYGVTELPRTTNELFEIFEKIYLGTEVAGKQIAGSATTGTYPITYVLGTNGYSQCAFDTWLAQLGVEDYNQFYSMTEEVGGQKVYMSDPASVYDNPNLVSVLEAAFRCMDPNIAANGTTTQTLDQAQAKIMKDGNDAVFMYNGDWMLNEVKLNYRTQLNDITFINTPVISALGVQVFGEDTTYNKTEEECDQILSFICKLVDENKTIAEIQTATNAEFGITLQEADAERVATARGVCYARGIEHMAYVAKGSTKKDIAALVLRMMASDDFAQTFFDCANTATPYANNLASSSRYQFVNAAKNIVLNTYCTPVNGKAVNMRQAMSVGTFIPKINQLSQYLNSQGVSMYTYDSKKNPTKTKEVYYNAAVSLAATAKANCIDLYNVYKSKDI